MMNLITFQFHFGGNSRYIQVENLSCFKMFTGNTSFCFSMLKLFYQLKNIFVVNLLKHQIFSDIEQLESELRDSGLCNSEVDENFTANEINAITVSCIYLKLNKTVSHLDGYAI